MLSEVMPEKIKDDSWTPLMPGNKDSHVKLLCVELVVDGFIETSDTCCPEQSMNR
jgi:hypothetical protein